MSLLAWHDVSVRFGGVHAVDKIDLEIPGGGVTAIIGPNGAGKTTLLNVAFGAIRPTAGRLLLDGRDVSSAPIYARAAAGMARTFQNVELFSGMTVLEHVLVGGHLRLRPGLIGSMLRLPSSVRRERAAHEQADAVIQRVGLAAYAAAVARDLPYGLQRRVELARALATEPRLVLLDEPMAGLSGPEAARLGDLIEALVADGLTVLLVEHHMETVMRLSERVVVMNMGKIIADGSPGEVREDPAVVAAYLGDSELWANP
jgi:ABC-type branched-subunit amino acid transport system ATPase component